VSPSARLRSVRELTLRGRRAFLRADLNVPLRNGRISDDTRIRASLPTLQHLLSEGARVIVASHLGRPKGERRPDLSLQPVAEWLGLRLSTDCVGARVEEDVENLTESEALLLENLRFHAGEEKNDPTFVQGLARLTDVYVNDAFGTAHRAHASTVGLAEQRDERAAGLLLEREVECLSRLRDAPERPYVCILGGAKVSDKLAVLEAMSERADTIVIGGAMAYTFLFARGEAIGLSLVEPEQAEAALRVLEGPAEILLPQDHVVAASPADGARAIAVERIPDNRMALDVGPRTVSQIQSRIETAATLFWNGPLGLFEQPPFERGTRAIAEAVAAASAFSVVGGGDCVAAVRAAGVADRIDHVSTGGGAALEFVEGRILPGIRVLERE
jgi:phosphoglycerate kinase